MAIALCLCRSFLPVVVQSPMELCSPQLSVMNSPRWMLALYSRSQLCPLSLLKAIWISWVSDRLQTFWVQKQDFAKCLKPQVPSCCRNMLPRLGELLAETCWADEELEEQSTCLHKTQGCVELMDGRTFQTTAWLPELYSTRALIVVMAHRLFGLLPLQHLIWFCSCQSPFEG